MLAVYFKLAIYIYIYIYIYNLNINDTPNKKQPRLQLLSLTQ